MGDELSSGWIEMIKRNDTRIGELEKAKAAADLKIERLESKFTVRYMLIITGMIMLASALGTGAGTMFSRWFGLVAR